VSKIFLNHFSQPVTPPNRILFTAPETGQYDLPEQPLSISEVVFFQSFFYR
jgi:hypothetical protein